MCVCVWGGGGGITPLRPYDVSLGFTYKIMMSHDISFPGMKLDKTENAYI